MKQTTEKLKAIIADAPEGIQLDKAYWYYFEENSE